MGWRERCRLDTGQGPRTPRVGDGGRQEDRQAGRNSICDAGHGLPCFTQTSLIASSPWQALGLSTHHGPIYPDRPSPRKESGRQPGSLVMQGTPDGGDFPSLAAQAIPSPHRGMIVHARSQQATGPDQGPSPQHLWLSSATTTYSRETLPNPTH